MKKILSIIILLNIINSNLLGFLGINSLFLTTKAFESKIDNISNVYSSGSKNVQNASEVYNTNLYDKEVGRGIKKLVFTEKDDNTGNSNYKLNDGDDGILSKDATIGIFSPGRNLYAPYVPLEFQINIPVGYEETTTDGQKRFINFDDSKNTLLRIPIQFTGNPTAIDVLVYGLDQKGEGLLGFDIFNSNKVYNIIKNNNKKIKFLPEGNTIDLLGETQEKRYNEYYNEQANEGYFVRKTDKGNDSYTILSHVNYGVNKQDTDGDGIIGNGYFSSKDLDQDGDVFKISSDIFVGEDSNKNNIYKKGKGLFNENEPGRNLSSVPEIYNNNNFRDGSGNILTVDGEDIQSYLGNPNNLVVFIDDSEDFKLKNSNSYGIFSKLFSTTLSGSIYNSNFLKLENSSNSLSGECNDGLNHSLKFFNECLNSNTAGKFRFFGLEIDSDGKVSKFLNNSEINLDGNISVLPEDIIIFDENNNISYNIGIPVIGRSNEENLENFYKQINIGNVFKFKTYINGKLVLIIPYLISDKEINTKLNFQKNIVYIKNYIIRDALIKLTTRDLTNITNLTDEIEKILSGKQNDNGNSIVLEKSFSDGSKYFMGNYGSGSEDKIISYNPNVVPYSIHLTSEESTLNREGNNLVTNGKVITLDFSDDNTNDGKNLNDDFSRRYSLNALFKGTPISKAYIRTGSDGKKYYYKVFIVQLKVNGDVSLGSNENQNLFLGKINAGIGLHTNPYLVKHGPGTFLSISTRKESIGFPIHGYQGGKLIKESLKTAIFTQNGKPILRFNEVDGDNEKINNSSVPLVSGYNVIISDYFNTGTIYLNLNTKDISSTEESKMPQNRLKFDSLENITIKTPTCIEGYEIYDNYKEFYKRLYSDFDSTFFNTYLEVNRTLSGGFSKITDYEKTSLLYLLNTEGAYRNKDFDALTTYFNYPKPFCVNKSWSKTGKVNDLSVDELGAMLKYYLVGIKDKELEKFNPSIYDKIKNPLLDGKNLKKPYFSGKETGTGGEIIPLYYSGTFYINPINIDMFGYSDFSDSGTVLSSQLIELMEKEQKNILNNKASIFYETYIKPSFDKLFITDRLIPEQYKLLGIGSKEFTSDNNPFGYNRNNSVLANFFKYGFNPNNDSDFKLKENKFVLNFLDQDNKVYFPIIGANLVITTQGQNGINYCSNYGENEFYFNGKCYNKTTGLATSNKPLNKEQKELIVGGAIYDYTKVSRIVNDNSAIPLTSGTTYYYGYDNIHGTGTNKPSKTIGYSILSSSIDDKNDSFEGDSANTAIIEFGRNIGGNMYSLLQQDSSKKEELGFFSNDNINFELLESSGGLSDNLSINYTGSIKIVAYPFFSPNKLWNGNSISDVIKDEKILDNIIKVPFHIVRNNKQPGNENTINTLKSIQDNDIDDSIDRVVNATINMYGINNTPVEDIFEKANGEYGIYFSIQDKQEQNELDLASGIYKNKKDNEGDSKILAITYSPEFASQYNGIQLSVTNQDFDSYCFDKNNTISFDDNNNINNYKCLLQYDNNFIGQRYYSNEINNSLLIPPEKSCITNPELESCKKIEMLSDKIKFPLSDQFLFSNIGFKENIFNKNNGKYLSLGGIYSGVELLGNGLKFVSSDYTKKYIPEFNNTSKLKESRGILSRKNIEIEKFTDIGQINDFIYNTGSIKDTLQNSMNYHSLYNDDAVIITNGKQYFTGTTDIIGGYINSEGKVNKDYGTISLNYMYSDNDNLKEDNSKGTNSFVNGLDTSQERRNRIRDEIKNNNHAYITLAEIPENKFNSINGILRIAKDPTKYYSNLIIQLPSGVDSNSQSQLLNDINPNQSIYSFNNLTIVYGNKAYTWGNNDTSCNGINPDEVYNRIDKYTGGKSGENGTRSDTITICLKNSGNTSGLVSSGNTLDKKLEIRLPIKPTKNYKSTKGLDGNETDISRFINLMNSTETNKYGYNRSDNTISNIIRQNPYTSYYVGGINYFDSYIKPLESPSLSPTNVNITSGITTITCRQGKSTWTGYGGWYNVSQGSIIFNTNKLNGDEQLKVIPQIYLNGFTIKSSDNLGKNTIKIGTKIVSAKPYTSSYSTSGNKYYSFPASCYRSYEEAKNIIINGAYALPFTQTFELHHDNISITTDLKGYEINYIQIPTYNESDYKREIKVENIILDTYKKTGNLQTSILGNKTNDAGNYIFQSLKENDYKVAIGDILTYKITVDATKLSSVPLQNFYVSQVLDRGLDLIPDSLRVYGTNLGKRINVKPIYNNDNNFKELLKNDTNTEFYKFNINDGTKISYNLNSSIGNIIELSKHQDQIIVTKGVLFLKVLQGGGSYLTSDSTIRYIKGNNNSTILEDNVNGLYKSFVDFDIIDGGYSRLQNGDIIILKAGENIIRSNVTGNETTKLQVLGFNRVVDSLLKYNIYTYENQDIDSNKNMYGIDPINTGISSTIFTPKYKQNVYYYKITNSGSSCPFNEDFSTSSQALTFTGIEGNYCFAYNKYMDYVYKGYLQLSSPYNRLIGPDISNPFLFGGLNGILDIYKIINNNGIKNINLLRNTERNTDREKMLLVNLGMLSNKDVITLTFDVKVNKYNDINHKLFNYTKENSNGYNDYSTGLLLNDNIINGTIYNKSNALKIYSHAKNTKVFFLNHIGEEKIVADKELTISNGESVNKLTVVPKTTLSIVNLSGRKNYYVCDPRYSSIGNCKKMTTLDTYDKTENYSENRFPEANIPLYKGQKFLLRVAIQNPYFDLNDIKNKLKKAKIHLAYNSNFLIFDNIVYIGSSSINTDIGNITFGNSDKSAQESVIFNTGFINKINSRISKNWILSNNQTTRETIIKDIPSDYKEIVYNINPDYINNPQVLVDFLFTVKHTENTDNINKEYFEAFNKNILSSIISSLEFETKDNKEEKYANTDSEENSAKSDNSNKYLTYNEDGGENNNKWGNINFIYYSIPFDKNYQINNGRNNINKTDFNPDSGKIKVRYFDDSSNTVGMNSTDDGKTGLAIELLNTKDSTMYDNEDNVGDFKITLPYGFSVDKIIGYRISDIDQFNTNLIEDNYLSEYDTTKNSYKVEEKLNKKIITVHPEGLKLRPGKRYTLYVYLKVDETKVDLYSTFNVETSLGDIYLFGDTQTSYKNQDIFDSIVKVLPTFSENDVFYGNRYSKNNVGDESYIKNNSGESGYYIIGENGLPINIGNKDLFNVKDIKYIDSGNKPKLIIDLPNILNENKNSYNIIRLSNGLILPNETNKTYNFQNNTVYYFDGDINIGDPNINKDDYILKLIDNNNKPNGGGVTIIANGKIFINTNIKLDNSGTKELKNIANIGFIGLKGTFFNPRVTLVEGYFYSPISPNTIVDPNGNNTKYSEGIITTGYANDSLKFKGGIYGGSIFNERNQGCGVSGTGCTSSNGLSKNQVENFEFNNLLYLNPPPVFKK